MMKVTVKIYDECKYFKGSKVVARLDYEITNYRILSGYDKEISSADFDEPDMHNEYLHLELASGETATFRNSYVDMFRA